VAAGAKVGDTIPAQGATGWADTWMLATKAPHPNCAYKWMQWATTPKVHGQHALFFGETPAS
jgi:putative spermidine/putrescine transport system substrate-binding protein